MKIATCRARTDMHFFKELSRKYKNNYLSDFDYSFSNELIKGLSIKIEGNWKINFLLDY